VVTAKAGDSAVQREAEVLMVQGARGQTRPHARLAPFNLPSGDRLEVDGVSDEPPVFVEASAALPLALIAPHAYA
jgi:hypothetical protein